MKFTYRHTVFACYGGFISQAIIVNLAPLLFLTFQREFGLSLEAISFLVILNFGTQLVVDALSAKYVDKIGYRACVVGSMFLCSFGLICMVVLPWLMAPYAGLVISVILYAVGGGLIEVLVSPIVEACPAENKAGAMGLLHSFYSWGHAAVILLSTLFFVLVGVEHWRLLSILWAIIPFVNGLFFMKVPIRHIVEPEKSMTIGDLFRSGLFWLFILLMISSGASEQAMAQWASAFAEAGLGVSKTVGDLLGPCCFAILMAITRASNGSVSKRVSLDKIMPVYALVCACGLLLASLSASPVLGLVGCALCGISCGIFWPGVLSIASRRFPAGGTAMFAFLALAGDVGCSSGPGLVGLVSARFGDNLKTGLLAAVIFPLILFVGLLILPRLRKK